MKAKLEFDLPEENEEYQLAVKGSNYYLALTEIDNLMRSIMKYEEVSEKEYAIVERIRRTLHDLVEL